MKYLNIREEELKNKVAQDFFWQYDCTKIIGNVDFCVAIIQSDAQLFEQESILWAEAKKGNSDIYASIVQLILTIGKARTFDKFLPPQWLAAFDAQKIAFIPYNDIHDVFYINDFNWNVAPSDHFSKEFKMIRNIVESVINHNALLFDFINDENELIKFISKNLHVSKYGFSKIRIDKNNFMVIYNKWLAAVKQSIAVNWDLAHKSGLIDGDFYLADLLSQDNFSLKDKLYVLLKNDHYVLDRKINEIGLFTSTTAPFNDNQTAHNQFWNKYERPPKEEYWDYIVERRDLLVPQDIRERKGSFFTPFIWVELSQRYLTDVLGEHWQDDYYVWDCAAGTGNLLAGLTNKYNIWASTLDRQDVEVMRDRIRNGANLLDDHVFQFDFLNDDFDKLPTKLQEIINDPVKRKKLVVYINPPYAEAGDTKQRTGTGKNKDGTTVENKTYNKYKNIIGKASNELFTQFLIRIYFEIEGCLIGNFSTLKNLQSPNFSDFRKVFNAKLEKVFLVPADTFDNVKGKFPIGFFIWNTSIKEIFEKITAEVFTMKLNFGPKIIYNYDNQQYIGVWLSQNKQKNTEYIGMINSGRNDFQNQNIVYIINEISASSHALTAYINHNNIFIVSIYFAVRHCIEATWLNDRDQFLYPNDNWKDDKEFQSDCLAYTLFHGQNKITSKEGTNHWIPFTEQEVNSREKFDSNFMTDYIKGKQDKTNHSSDDSKSSDELKNSELFQAKVRTTPLEFSGEITNHSSDDSKSSDELKSSELFQAKVRTTPLEFSGEAASVFAAGRELWRYYHIQPNCNVNASLYEIREHFQGRNAKGKMNNKSQDEQYSLLIAQLRLQLKQLAKKIEPKVYEYGFLK